MSKQKGKGRATPVTRPGSAADTIYRWLLKGRRTDVRMAWERWGISRSSYQEAIYRLRNTVAIDSDPKTIKTTNVNGKPVVRTIVSHQLVR